MFFVQENLDSSCGDSTISVSEAVKGTIAVKEAPVEVLEEDIDGHLPPQVCSVARPGEDDGKDALVGGEVEEREAPATGAIVTAKQYGVKDVKKELIRVFCCPTVKIASLQERQAGAF